MYDESDDTTERDAYTPSNLSSRADELVDHRAQRVDRVVAGALGPSRVGADQRPRAVVPRHDGAVRWDAPAITRSSQPGVSARSR